MRSTALTSSAGYVNCCARGVPVSVKRWITYMRAMLFVLVAFLLTVPAEAADRRALLQTLAQRLLEVRDLPVGAKVNYTCPSVGELGQLVGLTRGLTESILPKPDWTVGKSRASYFVSSPRPSGSRGGGFAEFTIHYDESGIVAGATCKYSR